MNALPFKVKLRVYWSTDLEKKSHIVDQNNGQSVWYRGHVQYEEKKNDELMFHANRQFLMKTDQTCLAAYENPINPPDQLLLHP